MGLGLSGLQNAIYLDHVVLPILVTFAGPSRPARLDADVAKAPFAEICVPYHAVLDLAVTAGLATAAPKAPLIAKFCPRAMPPGWC